MSHALIFFGAVVEARVSAVAVARMRELAAAAFPLETGGMLLGRYVDDHTALVTDVAGPCADAVHGTHSFESGSAGVAELLAALWPETYYLGDWHTHPASSPEPSETDLVALQEKAEREEAMCPQPVMLILGGIVGSTERWSATLGRRGEGAERLTERCSGLDAVRLAAETT